MKVAECCNNCVYFRFEKDDGWLTGNKPYLGICTQGIDGESPPYVFDPPIIVGNTNLSDSPMLRWEFTHVPNYKTDMVLRPHETKKYVEQVRGFLIQRRDSSTFEFSQEREFYNRAIEEAIPIAEDFFDSLSTNYDWWKKRKNKLHLTSKYNCCESYSENPDVSTTVRNIADEKMDISLKL